MILTTDEEAQDWLAQRIADVPRETNGRLRSFEAFLRLQNEGQNLVSRGSLHLFHLRHVADSVQILDLASHAPCRWLDLGSGAGFPGLMVALFSNHHVTLVESRRLRVAFLKESAEILGVTDRVEIIAAPIERVSPRPFDTISARAFAPLPRLLTLAHPFSTEMTRWLLPKGRSAQSELEQVADAWQGDFRLATSITDPDARIIIAEGVRPRTGVSRHGRQA